MPYNIKNKPQGKLWNWDFNGLSKLISCNKCPAVVKCFGAGCILVGAIRIKNNISICQFCYEPKGSLND